MKYNQKIFLNNFFIEYRCPDRESEIECRANPKSDSEERKEKCQKFVRQIPFLLGGIVWTSLIVVALVIPLWYNYSTKIDKTSYMVFQTSAIEKDGHSIKETRIIQVRLKLIDTRLSQSF